MNFQSTWISGTCLFSPIYLRQPSSRPLPLMQCLHQLLNGRCDISCSMLSCSLGYRRSCFSCVFFLFPNSSISSCFLCSSDSTSPSTSSITLPALLHALFRTVMNFLHTLVHTGHLKRGVLSFVCRLVNFTVIDLAPARASSCTTKTPCLLFIRILASARVLNV